MSRTASPLLHSGANGNGVGSARSKSPLSATSDKDSAGSAPTAIKAGPSVRSGAAKKASVLGAKKAPKLGAKKVVGADTVDFEEAEKKAKEEAERIERLGYNPDLEEAPATKDKEESSNAGGAIPLAAPAPVKPNRSKTGSTKKTSVRNSADVDSLGMGVRRLGFGQVTRPPAPKTKKLGGFGSVGPARSAADNEELEKTRSRFGNQKGISSDEFFGRDRFDPNAQSEAKQRLREFDGATSISSNAYFGRPEDELTTEDNSYGDLESAAKDFVRRFGITAGDDLENFTHLLGEGATKLQGTFRSWLVAVSFVWLNGNVTGAIQSYLNS